MNINLRKIEKKYLKDIYNIQFSSEFPEWTNYNAPYFNEYKLISYEQFLISNEISWLLNDDKVNGIFVDDNIIGVVSRHWENRVTRWLEVGIVIYDETFWNKGIGEIVLREWIAKCFEDFPEIERVGLTTWSGNLGMMKLSEKLGLKLEGVLRKVRFYNNFYYDSIKYGILREEFYNKSNLKMDCTFSFNNATFNYRVGALIVNDNKVLITKNLNSDYYFFPGGRVKLKENSLDAVKRELFEELNVEINFIKPLLFNENFFELEKKSYHEIAVFYSVKLFDTDKILAKGEEFILKDIDNTEYLYKWVSLDNVQNYNIKPKVIKDKIKNLLLKNSVDFVINVD